MTEAICKNCNHDIHGNYCSNCGQTAHTHTMDWHFVSHEIQHGIFHVDKGLLFTIKELLIRPGTTIRNFIAGKRVTYFKPVAMVIFLATVYGFLYHYFDIKIEYPSMGTDKAKVVQQAINNWMVGHYTLVILLMIPLYSLASKIAFMRCGYNFIEHMALNSFLAGLKLTVQILLFPLLYIWQKSNQVELVLTLSFLTDIFLTIYIYTSVFNRISIGARIFRIILSYILVLAIAFLSGILIGIMITVLGIKL